MTQRMLPLERRGLDFERAGEAFSDFHFTLEDARWDDGETRFQTLGALDDQVVMVVWTLRADARRIISMRRCHAHVAKEYGVAEAWTDPDDAPEWTPAMFDAAEVNDGHRVIKPSTGVLGRGRPRLTAPKVQVTLRLDADLVSRLRADGPGRQTRANAMLRKATGV